MKAKMKLLAVQEYEDKINNNHKGGVKNPHPEL